ncbi:AAA family ATPase [Longivirga aurantiaca]|uniref:AAA family ATPase n=1 Tax=Longivirga aurantiaca TaxID=1837743 RepID=A0ABW1T0H3_9ACTN
MNALDRYLPVGLRGVATVVPHPATTEIRARLGFTARHGGTMVVAGPRGAGKRIALAAALSDQQHPYSFVAMPPAPSENKLMAVLIDAVLGDRDEYELRDMQDDLVDALGHESSILVIDQAQELTTKAASQLQYLHARPGANWSLVLLGSDDLDRASTTSARLRGDIIATVDVQALKGDDLIRALRGMHASFGISDPKLLKLIDQDYCFGLLRRWGIFLQHTLELTHALDPDATPPEIDLSLARAATALMPPYPRPKPKK